MLLLPFSVVFFSQMLSEPFCSRTGLVCEEQHTNMKGVVWNPHGWFFYSEEMWGWWNNISSSYYSRSVTVVADKKFLFAEFRWNLSYKISIHGVFESIWHSHTKYRDITLHRLSPLVLMKFRTCAAFHSHLQPELPILNLEGTVFQRVSTHTHTWIRTCTHIQTFFIWHSETKKADPDY